ncbi:hypothetical protein [Absidia glauca]|uniref:Centrosomin N-terminal motif 1 domain-containing protein n=1 Tax=Absidia glauca TaxID=4829 RepID=A0A163LWV6_ABSGL|nr:hypothetical protein [Absidia glauca]
MSATNPSVTFTEQSPYRSRHGRTTGFSDTANCVPPRPEALTTSPNLSVRSSSTRHSRTLPDRPRSSSSSSSSSRHFYASSLGRPPGQYSGQTTTTPIATPTPIASSSFPLASSSNKTIPVKEIQKAGNQLLVTDLKKENFDLKLQLYHTKQQLEKDRDKCRLEDDNYRLRMELDDRKRQMEELEQAVLQWQDHYQQQQQHSCDASTQTNIAVTAPMDQGLRITAPATPVALTSSSTSSVTSLSPTNLSTNSNSYFPSDPASFGLTSSSSNVSSSTRQKPSASPTRPRDKMDIANIVNQFQNVRLHSPKTGHHKYHPSLPDDDVDDDQHGRVSGWLDRLIFPPADHLPLSPVSVPSTSSFHSPLDYTSPVDHPLS